MRTQISAVVAIVVAIVVGWFIGSSPTTSAQTQTTQKICHFEIYGPTGEGWTAYGRVNEPVIMLDQCSGATWQFRWSEDSAKAPQWIPIGISR